MGRKVISNDAFIFELSLIDFTFTLFSPSEQEINQEENLNQDQDQDQGKI